MNDANLAYDKFLKYFVSLLDKYIPLKEKTHNIKIKKPWNTRAILKSIKQKNRLYKMFRCTPNNQNETKYKQYRNKLNSVIRQAKRSYHYEKFRK